jgi:asparagine synthase (glutamine-hydrolysing)
VRYLFLSCGTSPEINEQSAASFCLDQLGYPASTSKRALCKEHSSAHLSLYYLHSDDASAERQSPYSQNSKLWALLDGEIFNLDSVSTGFSERVQQTDGTDTADVILALYQAHGMTFLDKLQGRFALIIIDHAAKTVLLYRSCLGQVPLYYHASSERIIASSEERAIVAHPAVDIDVNASMLASVFSLNSSHPVGQTAFTKVSELLPGQCLIWTRGVIEQWRTPLSLGQSPVSYRSDQEYADQYRDILERMVSRCLPESGKVGVMLSSGIDSAPAAAIAAQQLQQSGRTLTAYSWSLAGFDTADESRQIKQVADFANIPLQLISAVDRWPLYNRDNIHITANSPLSNAFQGLKDTVLEAAANDDCEIILNGWFGDRLFMFNQRLLIAEALREGNTGLAIAESLYWARGKGLKGISDSLYYRLRSGLSSTMGQAGMAGENKPWLSEFSRQQQMNENWPPEAEQHRHPDHFRSMTGPGNFQFGGNKKASFGRFGIEQRDLYRDEELIDFMLSIPLTQFTRLGQSKYIARNAAKGLIPENIRLQSRAGVLSEFYEYGLWKKERAWLRERLYDTQCSWDRYIDRDWLTAQLIKERPSEKASLIAWQCLTYELWLEKVRELERQKAAVL